MIRFGLALFVLSGFLAAACSSKQKAPTASTCLSLAGTYRGTFSGSDCARPPDRTVVISQVGCEAYADLGTFGALQGDVDEVTGLWNFEVGTYPPCVALGGGTASTSRTTITGSYSGTMISSGCCASFAVSFALVRQ